MAEYVLAVPDVGEGVAEVELVEWFVKPGDPVREDMVLASVMTDKATVEIPSPVSGRVIWIAAGAGETIAVKAPLVRIEIEGEKKEDQPKAADVASRPVTSSLDDEETIGETTALGSKPLASPAVRRRAQAAKVDLGQVKGTGPEGRITHDDLDAFLASSPGKNTAPQPRGNTENEEIKLSGLRRRIAEKMTLAASHIPHITYVEEVDVTALEDLRARLNESPKGNLKLTLLPFLMRALVRTIAEQPAMNATFDDEAGTITRHGAVHIGIATQTPSGLMVPVVRHAEARGLRDCAAELARVAEAARNGTASREELTGSTITITSLGALGGIVSTPVINHPEVAIIGVNKIVTRPVWDGERFVPRKMMNLSSSFDHRIVDGWDAAVFIQRIKTFLETPALIFIDE